MDHRNDNVDLKKKLSCAIDVTTDAPINRYEIDQLIQNIEDYSISSDRLMTVRSTKQCLTVIDKNCHRRIILITSPSSSQEFLPDVIKSCPYIERIYVLSSNISQDVNWVLDSPNKVSVFNSSDDLFARILYDIGVYYMQQGKTFSALGQHCQALRYFFMTKLLWIRANTLFHASFSLNLKVVMPLIAKEEGQLPWHIINDVLNDFSYR